MYLKKAEGIEISRMNKSKNKEQWGDYFNRKVMNRNLRRTKTTFSF